MEVKFVLSITTTNPTISGIKKDDIQKLAAVFNQHCNLYKMLSLPLTEVLGGELTVQFLNGAKMQTGTYEVELELSGVLEIGG